MTLASFIRDLHRDVSQFDSTWAATHSEDIDRDITNWWADFKAYVESKDSLKETPHD